MSPRSFNLRNSVDNGFDSRVKGSNLLIPLSKPKGAVTPAEITVKPASAWSNVKNRLTSPKKIVGFDLSKNMAQESPRREVDCSDSSEMSDHAIDAEEADDLMRSVSTPPFVHELRI